MYYPDEKRRSPERLATELFATRRTYLLGVARRHTACTEDAEDAMQEAFAAFLAGYDPAGGAPPLAWLTLVMKRACWRARERRGVCVEPLALAEVVEDPGPDPAERVGEREEGRRRLGSLKADQRRAVVMHAAGFTYGEIAGRCGWTQTKVNRSLYEGRRALRGEVGR